MCNRCKVTMTSITQIQSSLQTVKAALDDRLARIELLLDTVKQPALSKEEIITESIERSFRATIVILMNVPENSETGDVNLANDILEVIDSSAVVTPENVTRLGKTSNNYPRLLRIRFNTIEMAKLVLKKRNRLITDSRFKNIRIKDDKTKQQQTYLHELNNELKRRRENGENSIAIKYVDNIPRIISRNVSTSENSRSTTETTA